MMYEGDFDFRKLLPLMADAQYASLTGMPSPTPVPTTREPPVAGTGITPPTIPIVASPALPTADPRTREIGTKMPIGSEDERTLPIPVTPFDPSTPARRAPEMKTAPDERNVPTQDPWYTRLQKMLADEKSKAWMAQLSKGMGGGTGAPPAPRVDFPHVRSTIGGDMHAGLRGQGKQILDNVLKSKLTGGLLAGSPLLDPRKAKPKANSRYDILNRRRIADERGA
jgi:hypothetical protein